MTTSSDDELRRTAAEWAEAGFDIAPVGSRRWFAEAAWSASAEVEEVHVRAKQGIVDLYLATGDGKLASWTITKTVYDFMAYHGPMTLSCRVHPARLVREQSSTLLSTLPISVAMALSTGKIDVRGYWIDENSETIAVSVRGDRWSERGRLLIDAGFREHPTRTGEMVYDPDDCG